MADRSSDSDAGVNALLHEHLDESRPALVDAASGQTWTYGQLWADVQDAAARLARDTKALVLCLCRNDPATVIGYLAAVEAGHAVLLVDAAARADTLSDLIERYQPEIVLRSAAEGHPTVNLPGTYQALEIRSEIVASQRSAAAARLDRDLALLLPTSGSTGNPKLVRLSMSAVVSNASAIAEGLGLDSGERAITSLPLHYSYGLSVLNSHLVSGAAVILSDRGPLDREFWNIVRREECTSFAGVPYSYQLLERIGFDRLDLPSLRTMTQAGGKLAEERVLRFHELMASRRGRFFVMYGQTEATARIAILPSESLPSKLGSAGRAIAGGRIEIIPDGSAEHDGVTTGEIVYSGPNVMMGYALSRADLERGDELGGRLPTGDLGYVDDDGFVYVVGRTKRIAKISGIRIDLDDVEAAFGALGPVAVVGTDDVIVVFSESGDDAALDSNRRELAARMSMHYSALRVERLDQLPRTSSGKIDYSALSGRLR